MLLWLLFLLLRLLLSFELRGRLLLLLLHGRRRLRRRGLLWRLLHLRLLLLHRHLLLTLLLQWGRRRLLHLLRVLGMLRHLLLLLLLLLGRGRHLRVENPPQGNPVGQVPLQHPSLHQVALVDETAASIDLRNTSNHHQMNDKTTSSSPRRPTARPRLRRRPC